MDRSALCCASCGQRLEPRDIAMGRVVEAGNGLFCPACIGNAPLSAMTYVPDPHVSPTVLRGAPVVAARRPPPPRSSNSASFIVGGVIALVALGGLAAYLVIPSRAPAPREPVSAPKEDRSKAASSAADALDAYRQANANNPEGILEQARVALTRVAGTACEERVRLVLRDAERALEAKRGEQTIGDLMARAKEIASKDPGFKRRPEVLALYDQAKTAAAKLTSTPLSKTLFDARGEYSQAFEASARKAAQACRDEADRFERLERLDDAIAAIDALPEPFRDTVEGRALESRRRALLAAKSAPVKSPLYDDYRRATKMMNDADASGDPAKGYRESAELYFRVLDDAKNAQTVKQQKLTQAQVAEILSVGHYNVACYYSRFTKDVTKAVAHLEESIKAGYNDWKHLDADADLDPIRKTEAYTTMVAKYRK